ncbi:MAG: CHAT domain-containing protein [Acidobacteriota bacterium]
MSTGRGKTIAILIDLWWRHSNIWGVIFLGFLLIDLPISAPAARRAQPSDVKNACAARQAADDFNALLTCYEDLIEVYCRRGQLGPAKKIAEALAATQGDNSRRAEAWSMDFRGNILFQKAEYADAFTTFERAVQLMSEAGDVFGEAIALKDKGIAQKYLYRPIEAIDTLTVSCSLFQQIGDRSGEVSARLNIASAYDRLGFRKEAFMTRKRILDLARETGNQNEIFHSLAAIGDYYLGVDSIDQAIETFHEALDIADEAKIEPAYRAVLLSSVAWANYAKGDLDEALRIQVEVLHLSQRYGSSDQLTAAYRDLGDMCVKTDPRRSLVEYQHSLELRMKEKTPVLRFAYAGMAAAYSNLGDLDRSIDLYEKALAEFEGVRHSLVSIRQRNVFLQDHQFIYQGLVQTLLKRAKTNDNFHQDNERAFQVYEAAKAQRLLETISSVALTNSSVAPDELTLQHEALSKKISSIQQHLLEQDLTSVERSSLVDDLSANELELGILSAKLSTFLQPEQQNSTTPLASLQHLQAALVPERVLVAYAVGDEHTDVFIIGHRTFAVENLDIGARDLNARVQNYVDLLASGDISNWRAISERLDHDLVFPLLPHLHPGLQKLVIVPDANLHFLPFESLINSESGRYLIEDYEISYAPSGAIFSQLGSRSNSNAKHGALVFANPTLAPDLRTFANNNNLSQPMLSVFDVANGTIEPIPQSENEAHAIENIIGNETKVLTGGSASENQLKSASLEEFQILHFATHGLLSDEMPERSSLLLAPGPEQDGEDGFLQVREIFQLKHPPELVVLSACRTASGQILRGEGLMGISQGFLYAGARSVVGSLWNVGDRRSAELIPEFYREIAAGRSRSSALRTAKLRMINSDTNMSPLSWAPFILIGEPDGTFRGSQSDSTGGLIEWIRSVCVGSFPIPLAASTHPRDGI